MFMIISINAEYHRIHLTYLLQLMFPPCLVTLEVFRSPYVPTGNRRFFYDKPRSKTPVNTMVLKKRGNKWLAALPVISFSFTQSIRLVISFSSDCPSARPGWAGGPYNTPLSRNSHRALGAHRPLRTCRSRCSPFSSRTNRSCGACGALRPSGAGRSCNTRCPWAARLTAPTGSSHFPAITAVNNMLIHKIISPFCRILYSMNKTPSGA